MAGQSGDRIPAWEIFYAPVQTFLGVHLNSYIMGTGLFPGIKVAGVSRHPPTPPNSEVKERVEL
jgi:hypothetical protein